MNPFWMILFVPNGFWLHASRPMTIGRRSLPR
jgi:hypothetical protein